jgi:hypothetical protein
VRNGRHGSLEASRSLAWGNCENLRLQEARPLESVRHRRDEVLRCHPNRDRATREPRARVQFRFDRFLG